MNLVVVTAITLIQTCPLSTLFEIVLTVKCRSDGCSETNRTEIIEIGQNTRESRFAVTPAYGQTSPASVDVVGHATRILEVCCRTFFRYWLVEIGRAHV